MFAPRTVAVKGKGKAVDAPPSPPLAAAAAPVVPVGGSAQDAAALASVAEPAAGIAERTIDPAAQERLQRILFELEVALSDWGLARFPILLERLRTDADGWVYVNDLLTLSPLEALDATLADVVLISRSLVSQHIELDEEVRRVRRKGPVDDAAVALTLDNWADLTFYAEEVPRVPGQPMTLASARSMLSEILSTPVQTVRFPLLYDRDDHRRSARNASGDPAVYESHPAYAKLDKEARRLHRLPCDGGPFKGFAVIVLADRTKAAAAATEWAYERDVELFSLAAAGAKADDASEADSEIEVSTKAEPTPTERAKASGLRLMPIRQFNKLRAEYLAYKRALEKLEDEYDDRERRDWRERDRKRERDRYDRTAQSDWREGKADDGEAAPRPSDAARWGHRTPSPEAASEGRTNDAFVQLRSISARAPNVPLKAALNSLLASLGCPGSVRYVDRAHGSTRATLRLSDAPAAQMLIAYFTEGDPKTHIDAYGETSDAFEELGPMDEDSPMLKATLLSADEADRYRAEAKRLERLDGPAGQQPHTGKRRQDAKAGKPEKAKHMRFE